MASPESGDLVRAYEATSYCAKSPSGSIVIRVGQASGHLDDLLRERGLESWAFVSAANPGSVPLAAEQNEARQALLASELAAAGLTWYPGSGNPDLPDWDPEPGALVLGLDFEAAAGLGRRFGQLAVVCGKLGEPAVLVWCGT